MIVRATRVRWVVFERRRRLGLRDGLGLWLVRARHALAGTRPRAYFTVRKRGGGEVQPIVLMRNEASRRLLP